MSFPSGGSAESPLQSYSYTQPAPSSWSAPPSDIYVYVGGRVTLQANTRTNSSNTVTYLIYWSISSGDNIGLEETSEHTVQGTLSSVGISTITVLWQTIPGSREGTTIRIHSMPLPDVPVDYGGTSQAPLESFTRSASTIVSSGSGYLYTFAGSPISISAENEATVLSVTADRGLTIADGSLSGTVIGTADVAVTLSSDKSLTIHVIPVYRTVLYTPHYSNRAVKGVISTLDGTQTAQCNSWLLPFQRVCMLQTTAPIVVHAECIHSDPYPNDIISSRIPWIISEWDICLYKDNAYHHTGLLHRQIENYRDEITLTLTSSDYNEDPAGSGIFGISIRPYPYIDGVFAVFFDARSYGTEFPAQYILPGISLPNDPDREYELNHISAPMQGMFQIGPAALPMATVEVDDWQRSHTTSDKSDDISPYSPIIPEQSVEVSSATLGTITGNRIWYRPRTHLLTVDEDQDAILIFNNGGGRFLSTQRAVSPSAHPSRDADTEIGNFYYDWKEDSWYWFSGRGTLPVNEEMKVYFRSLPFTESMDNPNGSTYSLIPPDGMGGMTAWETEKPYFKGVDDSTYIGNRISFEYTFTARKSQDRMIRRTFYPAWTPLLNDGDVQRAILITPGHKAIEIHNIQTVTETYNVSLDVKPIVVYGYKRSFCMDLGVSKQISIQYTRPGLPYPQNTIAPTPHECDNSSGDSRRWSNAKWIEGMQELLNRWQMRTNGSELFLLRPGLGRLSGTETDADPMRSYITRIIGDNCYISEFSVPYADSPYSISGTVGLTIGTLYPKVSSRPLVTVNFYQPIYNPGDYPPGTMNNPYTEYNVTLYSPTSVPSDIYITEGAHISINGVIGNQVSYFSYGIRFSNEFADTHGLTCERTERSEGFFVSTTYYYTYSISGTLSAGTYTISANIESYAPVQSPNATSVASSRPFTIHVVPAINDPEIEGDTSYRTTSRRYPAATLLMLPEPASIFGSSGIQITTEPSSGGGYDYRVSGTAVSGWSLYGDETPFPPKKVIDVRDLYVPAFQDYRLYGIGADISGSSAHFFFPPTDENNMPDTKQGQRFVYEVTITPNPNKTMTVMWGIAGGGGGGGGAACMDSAYSHDSGRNTSAYFHSGGGGGSGSLSTSYIKETNAPATFKVCCGCGGRGGNSPEAQDGSEGADGTDGLMGQTTQLYLLEGGAYVLKNTVNPGYGGYGAKVADKNTTNKAKGGGGYRKGGDGSYDYEISGSPGISGPTSSVDDSGKGGAGGAGQIGVVSVRYGSKTHTKSVHLPGGGGGGGGVYESGMAHFANAGDGGSKNMSTPLENVHPRLPMAGYSAGGGGGGGYFGYTTQPIVVGVNKVFTIMPCDGGHGGHGWAYVTVLNGTITSTSNGEWQS